MLKTRGKHLSWKRVVKVCRNTQEGWPRAVEDLDESNPAAGPGCLSLCLHPAGGSRPPAGVDKADYKDDPGRGF